MADENPGGRAYLDHASTSPVRPAALEAMWPWLSAADPGRMHTEGRMARVALENAREQVASLLGTRPRQVILTSGATEAINAGVYGALQAAWAGGSGRRRAAEAGRRPTGGGAVGGDVGGGSAGGGSAGVGSAGGGSAVGSAGGGSAGVGSAGGGSAGVGSAGGGSAGGGSAGVGSAGSGVVALAGVEHSAVREASQRYAEWDGLRVLEVDGAGRIDPDSVRAALLDPAVTLVHCQWANHEVGTIQPIAQVVAMCHERGVFVHVDAAAAAGHVPVAFDDLGADLMSVSAHKFGGPRGIGALLVRRGLRVPPLLVGGAQERARRAGLENVAAAVGFGAAAAELVAGGKLATEAEAAATFTERLRSVASSIARVEAYGPTRPAERLPHLVCLGIGGVEAEAVLIGLDQAGVAAHSGSACSSEALEPSPVLTAMGVNAERSLRLSVGWSTTDADVAAAERALPQVVGRLRALAAS